LALPNKTIIWKARIRLVSKPSDAEENEHVAKKLAGMISKKFGPR
jgi:hypothetical protein